MKALGAGLREHGLEILFAAFLAILVSYLIVYVPHF
jgi:hypothetical protein